MRRALLVALILLVPALAQAANGTLAIEGGPDDAVWFLDGAKVEPDGAGRLSVPPGEHVLRLERGGRPESLREVTIVPGETVVASFPGSGGWRHHGPAVPAGPGGLPVSPERRTLGLTPRVEAVFAWRNQSLSGGGADSFDFYGAGARVSLRAERAGLTGLASLEAISYDLTTAQLNPPNAQSASVSGGETFEGRVAGGWTFGGSEAMPSLALLGGVRFETHQAQDLQVSGAPAGFLPSYQRVAVRVDALGALPLTDPFLHKPLRLEGALSLEPLSSYQESPSGSSGTSPAPAVGYGLGLGAVWSPMDMPWSVALSLGEERRSVSFSGAGKAPVTPEVVDGTLSERIDRIGLALTRSF